MRWGACTTALLLAIGASRAEAQYVDDPGVRACIASIPASAFTRVPIFLVAEMPDEPAGPRRAAADAFTARVATRLRLALGAGPDEVPAADSVLDWRRVGGTLEVTVHPDGRHSWAPPETQTSSDTLYLPGRALLERALQASVDAGEGIRWPEGAGTGPLTFDLLFREPEIARDLTVTLPRMRVTAPVFSMSMPWSQPVVQLQPPRIEFPKAALEVGAEGTVALRFVVDTIGRVERSSIRQVRPRGTSRPAVAGGTYSQDFVTAARQSLGTARYAPATVGGCTVRQLVQQPFDFRIGE